MGIKTVTLEWDGPHTLPEFVRDSKLRKDFDQAGVYLMFLSGEPERVNYVGKACGAPTLLRRQMEHYARQIGGLYTIPADHRRNKKEWVPDLRDPSVAQTVLNKNDFLALIEDAFDLAKKTEVYLAPYEDKEVLKQIERNLLYDLQPSGTKWGTKSPPPTVLDIRHKKAKWAKKLDPAKLKKQPKVVTY